MKKWYGLTLSPLLQNLIKMKKVWINPLPLFEKLSQNEKKYGLTPLSFFEKLNQNETSMG